MHYREEDFLALSGIQHFTFCRRQWALIHIEQQWEENLRTIEGEILHEKAHNAKFTEKRGDVIISRSMPVFSVTLGVRGVCDIVELWRDEEGVTIFGRKGKYRITPVEYKRGSPKMNDEDILQLTAQAMCLEEMFACEISEGYLYYGETNHRTKIMFTSLLRQKVVDTFYEMHQMFAHQYTPKVKTGKHCHSCSLANICLPKLCRNRSALQYIHAHTKEDFQ